MDGSKVPMEIVNIILRMKHEMGMAFKRELRDEICKHPRIHWVRIVTGKDDYYGRCWTCLAHVGDD